MVNFLYSPRFADYQEEFSGITGTGIRMLPEIFGKVRFFRWMGKKKSRERAFEHIRKLLNFRQRNNRFLCPIAP